ncbi:stress-induced protein YchH [Erwinia sp. E602]|uniref:stress-induced protein YchH n=1 Tax=Erwinia sp. E602 TaxID=2675378 RepID=UPI001BA7AA23|nr:stress-induced protein YchH [Erwinia sp. E602]QUG75361.1 stress-induced protein YchH [Erwinia sp. E602]
MKRKHTHIAGNGLMGLGLLMMVAGVAYAVVNQMPQFSSDEFLVQGAIFSIFLGALLWLVGARVSGREKITDRYYWVRHCGDKRCRQGDSASHHRPH